MKRGELTTLLTGELGEDRAQMVMSWVDQYLGYLEGTLASESWTAHQVARHLSFKNANGARSWLSRNKIEAKRTIKSPSGRNVAVYPVPEVLSVYMTHKEADSHDG